MILKVGRRGLCGEGEGGGCEGWEGAGRVLRGGWCQGWWLLMPDGSQKSLTQRVQ